MDLSSLPSISSLLRNPPLSEQPHGLTVQVARDFVDSLRRDLLAGRPVPGDHGPLLEKALEAVLRGKLRPVINATGIVVHTNLGRSPLPAEAIERISETASGYCNLELDLASGERGGRLKGVSDRICRLTGAEDCIVVNNNAAATMLALTAVADGGEVVVSRGELVVRLRDPLPGLLLPRDAAPFRVLHPLALDDLVRVPLVGLPPETPLGPSDLAIQELP